MKSYVNKNKGEEVRGLCCVRRKSKMGFICKDQNNQTQNLIQCNMMFVYPLNKTDEEKLCPQSVGGSVEDECVCQSG